MALGCAAKLLLSLALLLALAAVGTLPYLATIGHPSMPWPFHLVGADVPAGGLAQQVAAYQALLEAGAAQTAQQRAHEARVAAAAAALRAHPHFARAPALHVCTVASRAEPGLALLQASARVFGLEVEVLGMGDAQLVAWGIGLGRKAVHIAAFVAALPPQDLVLVVDAYDTVAMGRPSAEAYFRGLARALLREPADPAGGGGSGGGGGGGEADAAALLQQRRPPSLLFSAEKYCMGEAPPPPHAAGLRFPCLNSGGLMGPAGDLHALLTAVDWGTPEFMHNDQTGFYHAAARSRARSDLPLVVLDHDAEVFLTLLGVDVEREVAREAGGGGWRLAGLPPTSHPALWHYPSHYKRMSEAVGLLTGRAGTGSAGALRGAVAQAWAGMAAAALAGAAGALVLGGRGGGGGGSEGSKGS